MAVTLAPELAPSAFDLIAASCAYGSEALVDVRIEAHERTLLNDVLRCCVESTNGVSHAYLKIERAPGSSDSLAREYQTILALRTTFASLRPAFDCVEPLAFHSGSPGMLLLRECPGNSLHRILRSSWSAAAASAAGIVAAARATGQWVRHLEARSIKTGSHETVALQMLRAAEVAERRLHEKGALRRNAALVRRCRSLIQAAADSKHRCAVYTAHGDMHPQNVFVADPGPRICVIDFQLSGPQFIGFDALYFELSLLLSYGPRRLRGAHSRSVLSAFWAGYGRQSELDPIVRSGLKAHLVLRTLVYLAGNAREAGWLRRIAFRIDVRKLYRWLDAEPTLQLT